MIAAEAKTPTEFQQLNFEIIYSGPEVEDGSILARDLINALSGTSEAFSKIASEYDSVPAYELRVEDIAPGSVEIIFKVVEFAKTNPGPTAALAALAVPVVTLASNTISGIYKVLTDFGILVEIKRRLRGKRVAITPATFNEGTVILQLPEGQIVLTKEQYELLLSRRVDTQLAKIVSPLKPGRVDYMQVKQSGKQLARVDATERAFFDQPIPQEGTLREEEMVDGTLNSLNKTNMRGTFHTRDGVHVPYKYVGGDLAQLHRGFAAREPVRVHGKVKYGSDGIPDSIEVNSIESIQSTFFTESR